MTNFTGTLTVNTALTVSGNFTSAATTTLAAGLTVNGTTLVPNGAIVNTAGQTFSAAGATTTVTGTVNVNAAGGQFTIAATPTITVATGVIAATGGGTVNLNNAATAVAGGGALNVNDGTVTVASAAVDFTGLSGMPFTTGTLTFTGTANQTFKPKTTLNNVTLGMTAGKTLQLLAAISLTQAGGTNDLTLTTGNLDRNAQTLTANGALSVASGQTLTNTVAGTSMTIAGATTLNGVLDLSVVANTVNLNGGFTGAGGASSLKLGNSSLTVEGATASSWG